MNSPVKTTGWDKKASAKEKLMVVAWVVKTAQPAAGTTLVRESTRGWLVEEK